MKIFFKKKGFTLIELLVVIAIIGILSAIILASFSTAESRSRDTKRISDLSQIQLALAGYFDRCGQYPAAGSDSGSHKSLADNTMLSDATGCPSGITLATFIGSIPSSPNSSSTDIYTYITDSGYDDYFLHATLENPNAASNNSLGITPSWCSSQCPVMIPPISCTGSTDYCVGPK